ncbi:MAG: HNH endonuclease signature motif containing protein [Vulcanimicrobiota bacterium]
MSDSIGQVGQGTQYSPEMAAQLQARQARQMARDAVVEEQGPTMAAQLSSQETGVFHSFLNKTLDFIDKMRHPDGLPDLDNAKKKSSSSPHSTSTHKTSRGDATEKTSTGDSRAAGSNQEITLPLGQNNVTLRGIDIIDLNYVERPDEEQQELRKQFNSKYRRQFLKGTAGNPDNIETLKKAGLTDRDIQMMQDGKVPPGYQVHHKIPLDDGGTNDFSNLVLIKNDPPHKAITNYQLHLIKGIHDGGSPDLKWPVPPGFIYPTDSSQVTSEPK